MTSFEPQVGDIVKYEGKVARIYSDGVLDLEDGGYIGTDCGGLSLVERPERKIRIELAQSQIENLIYLAETHGLTSPTFDAAKILREAIDR